MSDDRSIKRLELVLVVGFAFAAAAAAAGIGVTALDGIPHVSDETSYLFQARILASGHWTLDPPPLPDLFRVDHVILDADRWCSKYPPGWPVLLAAAVAVNLQAFANPFLLALAVLGVWLVGRTLFDRATGVVAAAALAASPFAILMSAGWMAHPAALATTVGCLAALTTSARDPDRDRPGVLAVAGALGGVAFLVRPLTAILVLAPAVLWTLWRCRARSGARAVAWLAVGFAPALVALFAYQAAVFGSPWQSGYALFDPAERFAGYDGTYLTSAALVARNLPWYLTHLNDGPWGWPWPDLLPFAVLLWRREKRSGSGMLAACAAALVAGHLFYYYRDVAYSGPRFAFEALGPLSVLLGRAVVRAADWIGGAPEEPGSQRRAIRITVLATLLLAWPVAIRLPRQVARHASIYHGQTVAPLEAADAPAPGQDVLVFVAAPEFAYGAWFGANGVPPTAARPLYVRDIPALRERAVETFGRQATAQLVLELAAIEESDRWMRNEYPDRFRIERFAWNRARPGASPSEPSP